MKKKYNPTNTDAMDEANFTMNAINETIRYTGSSITFINSLKINIAASVSDFNH